MSWARPPRRCGELSAGCFGDADSMTIDGMDPVRWRSASGGYGSLNANAQSSAIGGAVKPRRINSEPQ
jgi:hypothetical protein